MLHAITDQNYYGMSLTDGSPVPQELLAHVEKLALEQEVPVGWNDGDVAVIDNYRLMHRRGEYTGTDRVLRALHGEELYGTMLPEATSAAAQAIKQMLQGEEDLR
jgi:alpha-ketoglutarate-dependent taurine dioxygenase